MSSSLTILTTCWAGLSAPETSAPLARSLMRPMKVRTTGSDTSASSSARRISRAVASISASVSRPLPRRPDSAPVNRSERIQTPDKPNGWTVRPRGDATHVTPVTRPPKIRPKAGDLAGATWRSRTASRRITTAALTAAVVPTLLFAVPASARRRRRTRTRRWPGPSMVGTDFGGDWGAACSSQRPSASRHRIRHRQAVPRCARGAEQDHDLRPAQGARSSSRGSWDQGRDTSTSPAAADPIVSGGVDRAPGPAWVAPATGVQVLRSWNPAPDARYLGWAYAPLVTHQHLISLTARHRSSRSRRHR